MAVNKLRQCRAKPSKENEEYRVLLQVFKSTNAWWRLIHVPIEIFSQQWVEPYSYPALSGEHIIANHLYLSQ